MSSGLSGLPEGLYLCPYPALIQKKPTKGLANRQQIGPDPHQITFTLPQETGLSPLLLQYLLSHHSSLFLPRGCAYLNANDANLSASFSTLRFFKPNMQQEVSLGKMTTLRGGPFQSSISASAPWAGACPSRSFFFFFLKYLLIWLYQVLVLAYRTYRIF